MPFVRRVLLILCSLLLALFFLPCRSVCAQTSYVGSATTTSPTANILNTATEILGTGGGSGTFTYKGGGNAVDAAVALALSACVVNPGNASLGAYGGHMLIYKAGFDGDPTMITCINFDSAAGSLATSNMFVGSVNPTTGAWTNGTAQNQYGWKAVGVPGVFAGLYMAQTNYGRKVSGTNFFPFAEMLKPALYRIAAGQAAATSYYTTAALSNLVMELYTNSPGYRDANGDPNPFSNNDPYALFYSGDIAQDIAAAMQANGGLVTYADMTNYRPREVTPYSRHFSCPNGTPGTVYVAPPGSSGLSVLQEVAIMDALGWTNGPTGTWDGLHYWHGRSQAARLMWKDHFQWIGDPWGGVSPPDFLGNGSTNFCDQLLAHVTNGYPFSAPSDPTEIPLTNSILNTIVQAVNAQTNVPILGHWDDIRYGTRNITTCDQWGNCVAMTFSMGGGYGAQVAVPARGLVFGQGMALFDTRPGWPNSIAPGKRQVDNMCPAIVVPDFPASPTNGVVGGRPPFAVGAAGGSTIENNVASQIIKWLMDPPSSRAASPSTWLYNFEANNIIYMRPSYPSGVQTYLTSVGLSAPGNPPSTGESTFVEAFIPPTITTQPQSTNVVSGTTVTFSVTATGLPLFYQWLKNGVVLSDSATVSGSLTPNLTVSGLTNSAGFSVVVSNGGGSVTSSIANVVIQGPPTISSQPISHTVTVTTPTTLSISAVGTAPLSFQWLKNGINVSNTGNISGATTNTLSFATTAFSDTGSYWCIVSNSYGAVTSQVATLVVNDPPVSLGLLWSVGPNDAKSFFNLSGSTSVPNQRTIAYNALSNQLYVVSRSSPNTSNYVIYVLNATNGSVLYTLKTNGIQNTVAKSGIGLVGICAADDGAIYACNESNDSWGEGGSDPLSYFRIYRWADANSNTLPTLVYFGDPSGATSPLRWGDCLSVRGTGTNTQLAVSMTYFNSYVGTSGSSGYAAILRPTDSTLTNFTPKWFSTINYATTVGRSIEFDGTNNAVWQKNPDASLYKNGFDLTNTIGATQIASSNILTASFPTGLMGIAIDTNHNIAAGVFYNGTTVADTLNLYDITDVATPTLLAQYAFPTSPRVANNNQISQTLIKNGFVFSIDANNGIMAFKINEPVFPIITSQPANSTNLVGTTAIFSVAASGVAPLSYQWRRNGTDLSDTGNISGSKTTQLTVSAVSVGDAGTYTVVVSNLNGNTTSSAATLTVTQPPSPLALYEPFNYSNVGSPVSSNTPANWTYNGSGANDLNVTSGSLIYPGFLVSTGNSVTNGGDGLGVRRLLGTNINSGKFYFSALFRINDLGFGAWSGSGSQVGALTSTDNVSFRLTINVKSNSPNGYVIGVQKGGTGATTTFDTVERKAGDTVLLVGKYDFTVTPNVVTLWINPASTSFGAPNEASGALTTSTGTDNLVIDRFNMRQNAATGASSVPANIQWDELRFGFTWWEVTPQAAPTIITQPVDRTVEPGSVATFSIGATGNFLSYQWLHNGVSFGDGANILGSATSSLTISPASSADAGTYTVQVSNGSGMVVSSNALLVVTNVVPRLLGVSQTATYVFGLSWIVGPGATYHFQYKNDLNEVIWQTLADVTPGSSPLVLSDVLTNSQRFYRLANDTVTGETGGFIKVPLLGNSDSVIALPFNRPPAANAVVASVANNVVTAANSPGWIPAQFVYASGSQTNSYYMRMETGSAAGWIFAITNNTANSVQLIASTGDLNGVAPGDVISIVPYWTFATAFGTNNGVFASPTPGNRTSEILIPDSTSAGINLSSVKIYYLHGGFWKVVGDGSVNHNDDILAPFSHFVIRQNTNANSTLTTLGGMPGPIAIALRNNPTNKQDNYLALTRPQSVSLANSQLISTGAFAPSPLAGTRTDELLTFDNNVATKNKSAAAVFYYWNGAWRLVGAGNADVSSSNVFVPGAGFVIRKNTNSASVVWTNSP